MIELEILEQNDSDNLRNEIESPNAVRANFPYTLYDGTLYCNGDVEGTTMIVMVMMMVMLMW